MTDSSSWFIDIPSQGIMVNAGKEGIIKFFESEIAFYHQLAVDQHGLVFANSNQGNVSLTPKAVQSLSNIVSQIEKDQTQALQQYIEDASKNQVLVGAGPSGQRVLALKASDAYAAALMACILAPKWVDSQHSSAKAILSVLRAIAFANPANFGFDDLVNSTEASKASQLARDLSQASAKKLDAFIAEKTELFGNLENLYRRQLTLQEPAVSWQNIATSKMRVWLGWLLLFAVMIIAPIVAALWSWEAVSTTITKITSSSSGGFSISGLAVISVPALFYAWLLKNISRVFIQNLNLSDDAAHRKTLALTYMGLLQDEKHPASDQERAIILNALFRPIPPQTNDEGPPAGLIDLIQKK